MLFVYRLSISGVEPSSSLLAIAVTMDRTILEGVGNDVMGYLAYGKDVVGWTPPEDLTVDRLEEIAFQHADSSRAQAQNWAVDTQQARILTRRTAIERSYSVRIARKEDLRARASDQRILRLYEGEIRNLNAALDAKTGELTSVPEPLATLELIAAAVLVSES